MVHSVLNETAQRARELSVERERGVGRGCSQHPAPLSTSALVGEHRNRTTYIYVTLLETIYGEMFGEISGFVKEKSPWT